MKRLTVSVPDEMWEALTAEAARMGGCDRSAVIRRAVREYLERHPVKSDRDGKDIRDALKGLEANR